MQRDLCRCGRPSEMVAPVVTKSGSYLTTYRGCNACYLIFKRLLEVNLRVNEVRPAAGTAS